MLYTRLNLDSTESLEAVQHYGTYIRVVACGLENVHGGVVHDSGGRCSQHDCMINNLVTGLSCYIDRATCGSIIGLFL